MMVLFDTIGQGSKGISVGLRMSETKGNDVFLFNIALFLFSCTMLSHIVASIRVPLEIVVWIFDTFDYNFGIKNYFTKYLKESCL